MDKECAQPILLQVHIPRTAGTSVSRMLAATFDTLHLNHYHPDPFYVLTPAILATLVSINPLLKSITSHHLRAFPSQVNGRACLYFTFLREPTETFVSVLKYARAEYENFPPEVQRWWPRETSRLALRDLAEQCVDLFQGGGARPSQVRFFCLPDAMAKAGLETSDKYGEDLLKVATRILEEFLVVGIVERMGPSIELLAAKLGRLGLLLNTSALRWENRTAVGESVEWLHDQDVVGRKVLAMMASDQLLYQRFNERLDREYQDFLRSAGSSLCLPQYLTLGSRPGEFLLCERAARAFAGE